MGGASGASGAFAASVSIGQSFLPEQNGATMIACELQEQCIFFKCNTTDTAVATTALKMRYCTGGGYRACARYIVSRKLGTDSIPPNLFPNQLYRLEEIIGFL